MAGVYIHIPFCKQKCTYCDFHFSTSYQSYREEMLDCELRELEMRKDELSGHEINTIYFGGGTPSLLSGAEIKAFIDRISNLHHLHPDAEITLESNPDDFSEEAVRTWKAAGINRLSIGIQSFDDSDLAWMNRAHSRSESLEALRLAQAAGMNNISIDLIYGLPEMDLTRWEKQLNLAIGLDVKHVSAYCLTVEQKTALDRMVRTKQLTVASNEMQGQQFEMLQEKLSAAGFVQYEISNFGKADFFSRHNSSYWKGEHYQGIGPSAHSFDTLSRSWNVSNNNLYIKQIRQGILPSEREELSAKDRFNELLLTGLRTIWGVSLTQLAQLNPLDDVFKEKVKQLLNQELAHVKKEQLILSKKGMLFADGLAQDLFL